MTKISVNKTGKLLLPGCNAPVVVYACSGLDKTKVSLYTLKLAAF